MKNKIIYILLISIGLPFGVCAQNVDLEKILDCKSIKDQSDRLKCFDTLVESINDAKVDANVSAASESSAEIAASVPEPAPPKTPEETFGDPPRPKPVTRTAKLEETKKPASEEPGELREITANIKRYWKNNRGDYVLVLENGQIWKSTSGSRLSVPQDPTKVVIKKGLISGYRMIVSNANRSGFSGRVSRIR